MTPEYAAKTTDPAFYDPALIPARIQAGFDLFEDLGWAAYEVAEQVEQLPQALDLGDHEACVLAAMYGTYERGKDCLGLDEDDAVTHGFSGPVLQPTDDTGVNPYWVALQAEWERVLDLDPATAD